MKLFLISQEQNNSYDTYDSAVVAAPDEEIARHIDPGSGKQKEDWDAKYGDWCNSPDDVIVTYIGEAADNVKQGVICASYNAG